MPSTLDVAASLRTAINEAAPRLEAMTDAVATRPRASGKWSPKQVIGHLVDSASNNHQRFVRAQFDDHLHFPGYRQDEWVGAQHYATADWRSLVSLWREFNLHLARVIESTPEEAAQKERTHHNLDQIAFSPVLPNEPVTLAWFMNDYVVHLRHHLAQVFTPVSS